MTNWTAQQQDFFEFLRGSDESCILQARAGTGKTTTLVEGLHHLSGSVLVVAFNVKIKAEFESRVNGLAVCKTMNGVGHRAMCNFFGRRMEIDRDKTFKIIKRIVEGDKSLRDAWSGAGQLVSRAKHMGLVPKQTPGSWTSFLEDTDENWVDLAAHHGIEFDGDVLHLARRTLRESISQAWKGKADFDDQIFIPCCFGASFERFDNVIVDEAQDLSVMQHRVIEKTVRKRIIAAGDEHQAIYGWRAAAADSIPRLIEKFKLEELPLTVSFRCGSRIIEEAQAIVPDIEAREDAPLGIVQSIPSFSASSFEEGDAVLCRNNGPIIGLTYKLITAGVPCFVIGRDIGRGLTNLISRLRKQYSIDSATSLAVAVAEWKEVETGRLVHLGKYSQVEGVCDKADSLLAIIEGSGATAVDQVKDRIKELFSRDTGKVALSTVHRAKGMEWRRVWFLDQHLVPSIWTIKAIEKDPTRYAWMAQEEDNIRYVAVTRAIEELNYVKSEDWT